MHSPSSILSKKHPRSVTTETVDTFDGASKNLKQLLKRTEVLKLPLAAPGLLLDPLLLVPFATSPSVEIFNKIIAFIPLAVGNFTGMGFF